MEHAHLSARLASEDFEADDLHVRSLKGVEAISRAFAFEVEVRTLAGRELSADCKPGVRVALVLYRDAIGDRPGAARWVRGIVDRVDERFGAVHGRRAYALRIVPALAKLEMMRTQEVFIDASVPEVIEQKLRLHGIEAGASEFRLDQRYDRRETIVQFNESDLAFVSRLAEHLGVSFFFTSNEEATTLVFTDHASGFQAPSGESLPFQDGGGGEHIVRLARSARRVPGSVYVQDHNYRSPLVELTGSHDVANGGPGGVVEYGSHHKTPEEGSHLAQVRAEELASRGVSWEGDSTVWSLAAGHRIAVAGHGPEDTELLVTSVTHEGSWPFADEPDAGARGYSNHFEAVPTTHTYRPELRTPRPRIHGFVTGIIKSAEGSADGSLPHLDEQGRYLVELQFDTLRPPHKLRASHRIRMAQPFAGPNHGMHFPLRPGSEVIVGFLDGDPERPVILGSVPNPIAPSPVTQTNPHKSIITTANGGIVIELGDQPF